MRVFSLDALGASGPCCDGATSATRWYNCDSPTLRQTARGRGAPLREARSRPDVRSSSLLALVAVDIVKSSGLGVGKPSSPLSYRSLHHLSYSLLLFSIHQSDMVFDVSISLSVAYAISSMRHNASTSPSSSHAMRPGYASNSFISTQVASASIDVLPTPAVVRLAFC